MRKLFATIMAVGFIFTTTSIVNAASVGSPVTQGKGKVAVGFDGSFIFDKNLNFRGAENIDPFPDEDVKDADIEGGYQLMLKTSYGILDNLDVYVKLGWVDYKIDSIFQGTRETGTYSFPFVMNTDSDFAYGLGVKGNYEFRPSWLIGYDLQYLRSKHDMYLTKKRTTEPTGVFKSTVMQEWHVAVSLGKRIKSFLPYVGVRYSDARFKTKGIEDQLVWGADMAWLYDFKFKADNNVGVFLGTDYNITKNLSVNIEGRFIDETAMSLGATYKF